MLVIEVESNARGLRVGSAHHLTKWQRSVVDRAIVMRANGATYRQMRAELGVAFSTLHSWISGRRRRPPDRVIVKRVNERDSFGMNHQRTVAENVDQSLLLGTSESFGEQAISADAVKFTVASEF